MTETSYRTGIGSSELIKVVEIDRCTTKSVWVDGHQQAKRTDWATYHDTWPMAQRHLLDKAKERVFQAEMELKAAKKHEEYISGMVAPRENNGE